MTCDQSQIHVPSEWDEDLFTGEPGSLQRHVLCGRSRGRHRGPGRRWAGGRHLVPRGPAPGPARPRPPAVPGVGGLSPGSSSTSRLFVINHPTPATATSSPGSHRPGLCPHGADAAHPPEKQSHAAPDSLVPRLCPALDFFSPSFCETSVPVSDSGFVLSLGHTVCSQPPHPTPSHSTQGSAVRLCVLEGAC